MKKWLVNKILGYDIFYVVDEIKRQREYYEKKYDKTCDKLSKEIEKNIKLEKELCVEKNRVIAKLEIIEDMKDTNNDLYSEVEKLKKINSEMFNKKASKLSTKELINGLSKRTGVSRINVEAYNRDNIEVAGPMVVLKVID